MEIRVECGWPCSSHGLNFELKTTNQWVHVEINVADLLVGGGADLTKLDSTLIIKPLINHQRGVRYQLDNIQWKKGANAAVKRKIIFQEHFNTLTSPDNWAFVSVFGHPSHASKTISEGLSISPSIAGSYYENWALETTLPSTININHKKFSIQFKPDHAMIGPSELQFVALDNAGRSAEGPRISLFELRPLKWVTVKFDSSEVVTENGFDANTVRKLKVVFYSNGHLYVPDHWGTILMDEIIITE